MLTRIALAIMWLLHFLPRVVLAPIGTFAGLLLMLLARERRKVVRVNLQLCFPELSPRERSRLARAHFQALGRALAETTIAWWSGASRVRKLAVIEGKEHFDEASRSGPVIVLAPHFVGETLNQMVPRCPQLNVGSFVETFLGLDQSLP